MADFNLEAQRWPAKNLGKRAAESLIRTALLDHAY